VGTRLKRLLLVLLILAGLYLLAINLFLNSPLGPQAFNRRPQRFQLHWASAWTVVPGLLHVRGLEIKGWNRNVAWTVTAERARGWIDLTALLGKTLRIAPLHGEEVRSTVLRGPGVGAPPAPAQPPKRGGKGRQRRSWTLGFESITLDHVREFRFNDFRLTGDGRVEGAFSIVLGGDFRLDPTTVRMPDAQLAMGEDGEDTLAQKVDLEAEANLGPYKVSEHPGLEGFDFLSGSLQAKGQVPELPFLERAGLPGAEGRKPGALRIDLRVEQGRLKPGSRFDVKAPADGPASPFVLSTSMAEGPGGTRLRLGLEAKGLSAGRRKNAPPLFRSQKLSVTAMTPETRLSRIFATTQDLRAHKAPLSLPLVGDVRADGVRIEAPGARASLRAAFDHASARVDLAGLLDRKIHIDGLLADGVSARMELAKVPPPPGGAPPPSVRFAGARFTHVREVSLGDFLIAGDLQAETTFSYEPDGTLTVGRIAINLPSGSFCAAGQPAAERLSLQLETQVETAILGQTRGLAFLRYVSGKAGIRAEISSLGFLQPYLLKVPWISLQGQGKLMTDVRLDHGRLLPGSRFAVNASPVRATIFDSLATGQGTVEASVTPGKTVLGVRFDRFGLEDLRRKGRPDYLQGRGLRISAVTPTALDLAAPLPDFQTTVDIPDAEVPDLTVYDALLPAEGGLSILGGRGRARLHLEASTATRKTTGSATLTSDAAKIRFQNVELQGNLMLRAPLTSPDLDSRRFDLKGTRLELDGITYRNVDAKNEEEPAGWWARAELEGGSIVWGTPLSLRGQGKVDMKSSGPLLALFAERSRFLRWFDDVLNVENVLARGGLRIGNGVVEIESLQATGGALELRSRMIFSKDRRLGDLYVRYGRLAAGIELRGKERNFKLRRPLEWYESRRGGWASP
jgi:hypothetical protein